MSDSILAGQTQDLQFDPETKTFKAKRDGLTGPTFTVQSLDYWQWQDLIGTADPVEQTRKGCVLALTAIDGDAEAVKTFLAHPKMRLINPLFQAIVEIAAGN